MLKSLDLNAGGDSATHWKSLQYFNAYRCFIAGLLFFSSLLHPVSFSILRPEEGIFNPLLTSLYFGAALFSQLVVHRYRHRFNLQLSLLVLVDVLVMTLLLHSSGGLRSGIGTLLLVALTGAGLVGQGRLVLFYAAVATLFVLFEQTYRSLVVDSDASGFFQAGVYSAGFFAVAISARLLASRVIANEELARQRGVELGNQTLISQRVIEEMQDGVLVVNQNGWVRQHNPRAEFLLGLSDTPECMLGNYSPELASGFASWRDNGSNEQLLVRIPANGMELRARFVITESSGRDTLVFLEDMGRLRAQAQQLKLAALGRLTASIAHEIRNPLAAISYAAELLLEERRFEMQERLVRITLDNTRRLERIVHDVLQLGRRDRAHRELIELRDSLPLFIEEFVAKEKVDSLVITLEFSGSSQLCFDRSHFHQVLWNLLGNAVRYSGGGAGSVRLLVCGERRDRQVELHVVDGGEGVGEALREQIFEPFFTTHSRGTGLGLYIARELCEANDARLDLLNNDPGAHFRILGRSEGCL